MPKIVQLHPKTHSGGFFKQWQNRHTHTQTQTRVQRLLISSLLFLVQDSSESDRSSPAPGWATQVEIEEDKEGTTNATIESSDKTFDSGLSSENSNSLLEKDVIENKFNLGEIVNFISSSWSSVSQDSSVSVFSASSPAHTDVTA